MSGLQSVTSEILTDVESCLLGIRLTIWCYGGMPLRIKKVGRDVNNKLSNKFDGPFRVGKTLPHDRYVIESVKGIRGYKRFSAIVAADALRPYSSCFAESDDSDERAEEEEN